METSNSYVLMHGKNISHNTAVASGAGPHMSIDKLFPALLECFGIVLCGYIAGRADVITESQAKGLGNFVSKFALPALLFKNMVLLDFGDVIWAFLWSVLVAKVTVFVLVCVLTLMVASPESRYSKAGLYAIFATQSNDFALGYPIVDALYQSTYPEYLQYIYLVAPVSLMLLNPIGFALCEVQRWRQSSSQQHSTLGIMGVVVLQVLKNPIVFMVIVGIISHFALAQKIPAVLSEFIDGLANSFGGTALFYLGLTMVGQLRKLTRDTGVALILLITAKLLVMPLVCKDMVDILDVGVNSTSANHTSLSNFAFLYGVFPTAPSVAIYAGHYNMELEVVTSGMVISTFLSAPIMYVSAWLLTIPLMDPAPLVTELENVSFNISIVSLVALVWTIMVMLLSRKFNRLPHLFALNLCLAQFLVCVSMILWNFLVKQQDNLLGKILTFTLLYGSLYSTYIWTGKCLFVNNDLLRLRPGVFMIFGWGVPFLVLGGLLTLGERTDTVDSAFFYGRAQVRNTCYSSTVFHSIIQKPKQYPNDNVSFFSPGHSGALCDGQQQSSSSAEQPLNLPPPGLHTSDDNQTVRHVLLCLLLIVCLLAVRMKYWNNVSKMCSVESKSYMLLSRQVPDSVSVCMQNLSSCLWWLFNQDPGRLYLELQFFCAVANYGQGFLSFGIFGLDKHLIILPFRRRLLGLWQNRDSEDLSPSSVPEEVRLTCTQFVRYHKDQCVQDIVHTHRYVGAFSHLDGVFRGSDLVDWLVERGLCAGRAEAQLYGIRLQQGGVIDHLTGQYSFRDIPTLLYRFIQTRDCETRKVILGIVETFRKEFEATRRKRIPGPSPPTPDWTFFPLCFP
uniref:G protein-coupled receptor 155b n=1 Tax=Mastacembelus armatus TaxID=205130 RepID=A0A7N8XC18_9TELE